MKAPNTIFVCQTCGSQAQKWLGRCPDCGAWNSMAEEQVHAILDETAEPRYGLASGSSTARLFTDIDLADTLDASRYIGRAPEQVDDFVAQVVEPIRERYPQALSAEAGDVSV